MLRAFAVVGVVVLSVLGVPSSGFAQPCNSALPVLSSGSGPIVNTYYSGFMPGSGTFTVAAGATNIRIEPISGSHPRGGAPIVPVATGDMLIVMQMQDATIQTANSAQYGANNGTGRGSTSLGNSGLYEYVIAQGPIFTGGACGGGGATCIPVRGAGGAPTDGLVNSYFSAPATAGGLGRGQLTFQVIRVPRYTSGTFYGALTTLFWNGRNGGVLAMDVVGNLDLGGAIVSVDFLGYRGAVEAERDGEGGLVSTDYRRPEADDAHGRKGEGIAGTPIHLSGLANGYPQGDRARGAPGNAGGGGSDGNPSANDQNTGGGGGANGGNGGKGGDGWDPDGPPGSPTGGVGGEANPVSPARLIPGGGGGAGTRNNAGPSSGGDGGGIVMVRAGTVTGTGTVRSRGESPVCSANDGGGAGGAGGTILFYAEGGVLAGLTADVTGGRGGDANIAPCPSSGTAHGPGGGGGGGMIFASGPVAAASTVAGGGNGLTNGNIAFGAQPGNPGPAIVTTLTAAQITGVQTCTLATRATLAGLRVDPGGVVEFATASQRRTLAFNVYATSDPKGHLGRIRLNERPLPAALPDTSRPTLYRTDTPSFKDRYVAIEEIELSGRPRLLGTFAVDDAALREAFERVEARAEAQGARETRGARMITGRPRGLPLRPRDRSAAKQDFRSAKAKPIGPSSRPGSWPLVLAPAVKVDLRQAGQVTVRLEDLVAAGLPATAWATPEAIAVWNVGQTVPSQVVPGPDGLPEAITFTARTLSTDYSDRNPYVVVWGPWRPPAPPAKLSRSGPAITSGMVRVERNTFHVPSLPPGADPWVWDYYISDVPGAPQTFDLPTLAAGQGMVPVQIHVTGATDHTHNVEVRINGYAVGEVSFPGRTLGVISGTIPGGLLQASGNELTATYTAEGSTEDDWGAVFLDAVDLGIVEDLSGAVPYERLATYEPASAVAGADYLIVTHSSFRPQADRLAALKAAEGRRPAVVDVDRIYDAMSGGVMEAAAISSFLRKMAGVGLGYVLLLGDDTFDPRDNLGLGFVAFVPSLPAWDGEFGRVASENRYADLDDDGRPELAIGRLPAKSPAEADVLVDKVERQSQVLQQAGATHLFAVDNQTSSSDVDFLAKAMRAANHLPPGSQLTWAMLAQGVPEARTILLDGLRSGSLATHYFGHGGPDLWADEHFLDAADLPGLAGTGRGTVVFTWTCETQWYQYDIDSINEGLLLVPDGAAYASVGPTGISDPDLQSALSDRVYTYFLRGLSLGEAVRRAKAESLEANPATRPVVDGWSLLGDPSLRLQVPKGPKGRR